MVPCLRFGLPLRGTSGLARESMGETPHLYAHLLILLPSPCTRGEGLGVRGLHCVLIWILIVNSMSSLVSEA